jgi:hypothetical protein
MLFYLTKSLRCNSLRMCFGWENCKNLIKMAGNSTSKDFMLQVINTLFKVQLLPNFTICNSTLENCKKVN